jgi:hypothetical protein
LYCQSTSHFCIINFGRNAKFNQPKLFVVWLGLRLYFDTAYCPFSVNHGGRIGGRSNNMCDRTSVDEECVLGQVVDSVAFRNTASTINVITAG